MYIESKDSNHIVVLYITQCPYLLPSKIKVEIQNFIHIKIYSIEGSIFCDFEEKKCISFGAWFQENMSLDISDNGCCKLVQTHSQNSSTFNDQD